MKAFSKFMPKAVLASVLAGAVATALASSSPLTPPADAGPTWRAADGSTALQWAAYGGDVARVKQLLKQGADAKAANNYGANAMQLAAEIGSAEIIRMLLDAGANVESPNAEGQTALMLVARTGNVDAAKLLVKHGANVNAREAWGEQTALMWATARHHPEMVKFLIASGAEVNTRSKWRDYQRHLTAESRAKNLDTGGLTPLLYSIRENCMECFTLLLANKADVNMTDPDGASPLLFAIFNTRWEMARTLIESGADIDHWDKYGDAPLYAASTRAGGGGAGGRGGARGGPPAAASTAKKPADADGVTGATIVQMLLDRGADPNMQLFMRPAKQRGTGTARGTTPLQGAAAAGDLETVKLLIAHGADVNLTDTDSETPMMLVMQSRNEQVGLLIMDELKKAGADVNVNAQYHHLKRTRGGTALHYAVRAGWKRAIDKLVAFGADLDIKDPDGLTALDYAMARGYIPFLQMRQPARNDLADQLRKAGAKVELSKEPAWPPVGPPLGYEATIWPLGS
ncbi:MAG TPA: ankyrin repeat domain-containing protein [Candidatus Acidoferrum sp.]|nr:ankyrin repeat domain-containing protein [Candidatus Acidoferrum sp.]